MIVLIWNNKILYSKIHIYSQLLFNHRGLIRIFSSWHLPKKGTYHSEPKSSPKTQIV